jgi:hypothetical protein
MSFRNIHCNYGNVLIPITCFCELTGADRVRITAVGHNLKRRRFEDLHRLAIHWPTHRFTYEGVPLGSEADEREVAVGEVRFFTGFNFRSIADHTFFCFLAFVEPLPPGWQRLCTWLAHYTTTIKDKTGIHGGQLTALLQQQQR